MIRFHRKIIMNNNYAIIVIINATRSCRLGAEHNIYGPRNHNNLNINFKILHILQTYVNYMDYIILRTHVHKQ